MTAFARAALLTALASVAAGPAFAQETAPETPEPASGKETVQPNGEPEAASSAQGDADEATAADEEDVPAEYDGKVSIGWLSSSGNTESTSFNGELGLSVAYLSFIHSFNARAIRATESGQITAERYTADAKSEYNFTEHNYLFLAVTYEKDEFAGFDRRTSETVGYGRRLINTESTHLDLEVGAGARQTRVDDAVAPREETDTIIRSVAEFNWALNGHTTFEQKLLVESGSENTFNESLTSFRTRFGGNLFWKVTYNVKHNTTVQPGRENTDRYTTVSLEYDF